MGVVNRERCPHTVVQCSSWKTVPGEFGAATCVPVTRSTSPYTDCMPLVRVIQPHDIYQCLAARVLVPLKSAKVLWLCHNRALCPLSPLSFPGKYGDPISYLGPSNRESQVRSFNLGERVSVPTLRECLSVGQPSWAASTPSSASAKQWAELASRHVYTILTAV